MEFRIITHHVPPRVFIYADAERACRKVRTLQRLGVSFTLTNRAGEPVSVEDLYASPQR
jgi:hypothetical protein